MIEAQRIACHNKAWVVMSFAARSDGFTTPQTDSMVIGKTDVIDLANYPIQQGLVFSPDVVVSADIRRSPPPAPEPITFTMNGCTATYDVSGYTFDWTVAYQSLSAPSGRPTLAGFPDNIPLFVLPYDNWDQQITSAAVPICAPLSADDVVAVCNWAKGAGYLVRPRGVMHGWSPLTLPTSPDPNAKVILVDLTKSLYNATFLPASDGLPNRVKVQTGALMLNLLEYLEAQTGGQGSASGYSFPHTPGPGNLTVGGVLAINAHGTAVPTPPNDQFAASYGSLSNQIVELTAVVTNPGSPSPNDYALQTFTRSDPDAKALLTHLGRALLVDATLQVVDNYNLRCQSFTNISWQTLFAAPGAGPSSRSAFADFLATSGRVEIIWFPFSDNPWIHVWTVEPTQPTGSVKADHPYNYPFADHVPATLQVFINQILAHLPSVTPDFGKAAAQTTANGLDGKDAFGHTDPSYQPPPRDLWGPSKNTLLYIQDTTLQVTANGYAVQMKKADVQQAVSDFANYFNGLLASYAKNGQYPINSAVEIRVTALDDPSQVGVANAESPVISALSMDNVAAENGWDVALWLDVLTLPGTASSNQFYVDLETWILGRFTGSSARVLPEWSKGWAYTADQGPWTNTQVFDYIRKTLTDGRDSQSNWAFEVATLQKYDQSNLFSNALLDQLFQA